MIWLPVTNNISLGFAAQKPPEVDQYGVLKVSA